MKAHTIKKYTIYALAPRKFPLLGAIFAATFGAIVRTTFGAIVKITFAAFFATTFLAGCHRHAAQPPADTAPEAWLKEDPKACLKYYTDNFTKLSAEWGYDSVRVLYAGLLRRLPEHPAGNADSIALYTNRLLAYYNNTFFLSPTDTADRTRPYREGVRLPDSLLRSSHAFYSRTARPELLAYTAQLYMMTDDDGKADSLTRLLLALPVLEDDMRALCVYHTASWTAGFCCPELTPGVTLQERAVAACRRGGTLGKDGIVFSRMGYFYRLTGRYEEAVDYLQEAADYYAGFRQTPSAGKQKESDMAGQKAPSRPERNPDGRLSALAVSDFTDIIHAYGDLASLYATLGLYDKAMETNRIAEHYSRQADDLFLTDLYRLRGEYLEVAGERDSAVVWYDSAYAVGVRQNVPEVELLTIRRLRITTVVEAHPDSAAHYLEASRTFLADSAKMLRKQIPDLYFLRGMTLFYTPGHQQEALPYFEEAVRRYHARNSLPSAVTATDFLLQAYAATGRHAGIARLYPPYAALRDSLLQADRQRFVIGANVRYETGRKEQENHLLAARLQLKQRTLVFAWMLAGLFAVLLSSLAWYVRQRQRYHRRVSEARLSQISSLLNARQELMQQNESLAHARQELLRQNESLLDAHQELMQQNESLLGSRQELMRQNESLADSHQELLRQNESLAGSRQELLRQNESLVAELQRVPLPGTSGDLRSRLSNVIFSFDQEAEFRRSFTALYPNYLPALHRIYTGLTRTDELIAMLLLLDLANDEIALTLGISKSSVHKARSRLRKRLGLEADVKLEEYLKEL